MYLTVKQQVKHLSKEDYKSLRTLCHTAKNLTNQALQRKANTLLRIVNCHTTFQKTDLLRL